mmetsp:Transcript_28332/g.35032  ORF Transcript_28332/g.35032 Transcript_28332/m.35032 type:complete len:154 (+) Transcript_28332:57-518(+)
MVSSLHSQIKRSHPCLDLLSLGGDHNVEEGQSACALEASNKARLSSIAFGWDHYRSVEEMPSAGREYQMWRSAKRKRRGLTYSKSATAHTTCNKNKFQMRLEQPTPSANVPTEGNNEKLFKVTTKSALSSIQSSFDHSNGVCALTEELATTVM